MNHKKPKLYLKHRAKNNHENVQTPSRHQCLCSGLCAAATLKFHRCYNLPSRTNYLWIFVDRSSKSDPCGSLVNVLFWLVALEAEQEAPKPFLSVSTVTLNTWILIISPWWSISILTDLKKEKEKKPFSYFSVSQMVKMQLKAAVFLFFGEYQKVKKSW